jgi:hypothetical protein
MPDIATVHIRVPRPLQRRVNAVAHERGISANALFNQIVGTALNGTCPVCGQPTNKNAPAREQDAGGTTAKEQDSNAAEPE